MNKFRISFNPNIFDFNILNSQLDKHGFSDNITQPHDRNRICESFENNRFVVMYADGELEKTEQTGTVERRSLGHF